MDSREYQSVSLRTVPPHLAYWTAEFAGDRDDARRDLLCNCALGLAGEAAEIDAAPSSDEIGDGYWYAYVLLYVLGVQNYAPQPGKEELAAQRAYRCAGTVCELVKKHAFHGRDLDTIAPHLVDATRGYVDALAALDRQPASETFAQNVAKLRARYPEGFFERG